MSNALGFIENEWKEIVIAVRRYIDFRCSQHELSGQPTNQSTAQKQQTTTTHSIMLSVNQGNAQHASRQQNPEVTQILCPSTTGAQDAAPTAHAQITREATSTALAEEHSTEPHHLQMPNQRDTDPAVERRRCDISLISPLQDQPMIQPRQRLVVFNRTAHSLILTIRGSCGSRTRSHRLWLLPLQQFGSHSMMHSGMTGIPVGSPRAERFVFVHLAYLHSKSYLELL